MDISLLRNLPPEEQISAIVNSPDAMKLVHSLPAEELLLAIKKVGRDDSLELIELLSAEQLKVIFDLDVWQHDQIDDHELSQWLAILESANPESALEQMAEADIEFLTILLRNNAEIFDLIENEDPYFESDLILYTSDRHYLLAFKTEGDHEVQSRFLKRLIDDIMGRDFLFAIRLIESARFETESMLYEDALRLRDGRLQDRGFLPLSESRSILTYVDVDKAKEKSFFPQDMRPESRTATQLHYNIPSLANLPFLRESLLGLSHATLESSWGYIVTVANRVHMAQFGKYSDLDAVNESAVYTLNLIEMALSYLTSGDISRAKQIYLSHAPQDLFKIGHSLILRLQRDFQKVRQHPSFHLAGSSLARLDSPLREVLIGVLRPEPLFYQGLTDPKQIDYRPFENVRDVAQASAAVSEASFRCALLGKNGLGFSETEVSSEKATPCALGVLLATYFVQLLVHGKGGFEAVTADGLRGFYNRLELLKSGRSMSRADKDTCIRELVAQSNTLIGLVGTRTQEDLETRVTNYAHIVFGFIESELCFVEPDSLDARLITSILVKVD